MFSLARRVEYCLQKPLINQQYLTLFTMVSTSDFVRLRLFSFFRANVKISKIVRELFNADGIKISRNTVSKYYKCFRNLSYCGDARRSSRPPKIQERHFNFIDRKMEENDELTAPGK